MFEIIKFEKNGCMPCKKLDMILDKFNVEIKHKNIDEEDCSELIEKYNISSTPTLLKIVDEDKFFILPGINYTMNEFKEFLEVEDSKVQSNNTVGCENGNCSL